MLSIYQCPVCGGRECTTSGDCARGCVSPIKTVVTVSDVCGNELARLTRERDEAIALATAMKTASVIAIREREQAERERDEARADVERLQQERIAVVNLRALLREWLDDATHQQRPWATNADGRTLPERTWAVTLEE